MHLFLWLAWHSPFSATSSLISDEMPLFVSMCQWFTRNLNCLRDFLDQFYSIQVLGQIVIFNQLLLSYYGGVHYWNCSHCLRAESRLFLDSLWYFHFLASHGNCLNSDFGVGQFWGDSSIIISEGYGLKNRPLTHISSYQLHLLCMLQCWTENQVSWNPSLSYLSATARHSSWLLMSHHHFDDDWDCCDWNLTSEVFAFLWCFLTVG